MDGFEEARKFAEDIIHDMSEDLWEFGFGEHDIDLSNFIPESHDSRRLVNEKIEKLRLIASLISNTNEQYDKDAPWEIYVAAPQGGGYYSGWNLMGRGTLREMKEHRRYLMSMGVDRRRIRITPYDINAHLR